MWRTRFFLFIALAVGMLFLPLTEAVFAQGLPAHSIQHELLTYDLEAGQVQTIEAPFFFQAFAIDHFEGVEVRYRQRGVWTEWTSLVAEEESSSSSELRFVASSDAFSLRSQQDARVQVTLMDLFRAEYQTASLGELAMTTNALSGDFRVLARSEWGANEALRTYDPSTIDEDDGDTSQPVNICAPLEEAFPGQYRLQPTVKYFDDRGRNLIWPESYSQQIKKVVIHHTAQSLRDLNDDGRVNATDYRLAVQAIYTYHTVSNGWGDIGYHYLVDPDGNVYEGRAGGQSVIGAHVLCQNSNTIGIAVMGNFEEERLSRPAFEGLVNITQYVTEQYGINPLGESSFRGTVMPHIVTHSEVGAVTKSFIGRGATQCPGTFLKQEMMSLRRIVADGGLTPDLAYELLDRPQRLVFSPLEEGEIVYELKNTGQQMWTSLRVRSTVSGVRFFHEETSLLVAPGQSYRVRIPFSATLESQRFSADLSLSLNGKIMSQKLPLQLVVERPQYRYDVVRVSAGPESLLAGEQRQVEVSLKNRSNFPWPSDGKYEVRLRQLEEQDGNMVVLARGMTSFLSKPVAIGEEARFVFDVPSQDALGPYELQFAPVLGANTGFYGRRIVLSYDVQEPRFAAAVRLQDRRLRLEKGFAQDVDIVVMNTGNFPWDGNTVSIGFGETDPVLLPQMLKVGESLNFKAPARVGYFDQQVTLEALVQLEKLPELLEGARLPVRSQRIDLPLRTTGRVQLVAEYVDQSLRELPNESGEHEVWVDLKNVGSVPWYADGNERIVLVVQDQADFTHRSWEQGRIAAGFLEQEVVMPGEVGRFSMTLQVRRKVRQSVSDLFVPQVLDEMVRLQGDRIRFEVTGSLPERRERTVQTTVQTPSSNDQDMQETPESQDSSVAPLVSGIPPMRVLLTEIDQDLLTLTASAPFRTWVSRPEATKSHSSGAEVKVLASQLEDGTIIRMRVLEDGFFRFTNWDRIRSFGAGINDNTFRGVLEFRWDVAEGKMIVINELSLEEYMKGIAEVPETSDQPQEKRKVIAVLARSYALHYLISGYEKFPGKPYNAADSPAIFQKYVGQNFETRSPKWQKALEETKGEVVFVESSRFPDLSEKERVLRAAYFSCTDGQRTKSWDEVWFDNAYFQRFGSVFQSVLDPLGDDPTREGLTACGHQVGLSGYGATQMAAQGQTYDEIIDFYYQDVEIAPFE